jgi:AzlC protein
LALAAFSFGAAFGVLAETAGMGTVAPIVMSATTFAGAAQFAAASVLDEGGGVLAAVAAAVLLNARYAAISLAVAPAFEGGRLRRLLESQLIVDESWAVSLSARASCSSPPGWEGRLSASSSGTSSAIPSSSGSTPRFRHYSSRSSPFSSSAEERCSQRLPAASSH